MKKYLTLGVVAIAALALAGCGMKNANSTSSKNAKITPTATGSVTPNTSAGGVPIPQRTKPAMPK